MDNNLLGGCKKIYKEVTDKTTCDFYHVVELPNGAVTAGQWDLRKTVDDYLGKVDFSGKSVIEIGPASGFLSFHMERLGARVACVEPGEDNFWDLVPQAGADLADFKRRFWVHIERVHNSFWFLHRMYKSNVEYYEADAYNIPPQKNKFNIALLASILCHVSSPVKMLESVASLGIDQIIIVDRSVPEIADHPVCRLVPSVANRVLDGWWEFSPKFYVQYLAVLGFTHTVINHHRLLSAVENTSYDFFTIVGSRQSEPLTWENFNEAAYLAANPDVAEGVRNGQWSSGRLHFDTFGFKEGRPIVR